MGGVSSSQSMVLSTLERMLLIQRAEGFHGNDVIVCLSSSNTSCYYTPRHQYCWDL